jgi:hypothetical protein
LLWDAFQRTVEEPAEEAEEDVAEEGGLVGFPSIPHLPFSPSVHSDDVKLPDSIASAFVGRVRCSRAGRVLRARADGWLGQPVVVTEKVLAVRGLSQRSLSSVA